MPQDSLYDASTRSIIQHIFIEKQILLGALLKAAQVIKIIWYCPCLEGFYSLRIQDSGNISTPKQVHKNVTGKRFTA